MPSTQYLLFTSITILYQTCILILRVLHNIYPTLPDEMFYPRRIPPVTDSDRNLSQNISDQPALLNRLVRQPVPNDKIIVSKKHYRTVSLSHASSSHSLQLQFHKNVSHQHLLFASISSNVTN